MNYRRIIALAIISGVAAFGGLPPAMGEEEPPTQAGANDAYQARDWEKSASAYGAIVEADPANASAWYRLAVSLRQLGRYLEVEPALVKAEEAGIPQSYVEYERAKATIQLGDQEAAMSALEAAVAAGFGNHQALESDTEFKAIRSYQRFGEVLALAKRNSQPCEETPEHRQFDFWVGEWDVYDQNNNKAGENRIRKVETGCLLLEQWTGATGGTGTSMNFYDPDQERWEQIWVGGGGGSLIRIAGGISKDGSMRLEGTILYISTLTTHPFRGTWTALPDMRVRQFFEQSTDGGETWTPWFEGFYVRQESRAQ